MSGVEYALCLFFGVLNCLYKAKLYKKGSRVIGDPRDLRSEVGLRGYLDGDLASILMTPTSHMLISAIL